MGKCAVTAASGSGMSIYRMRGGTDEGKAQRLDCAVLRNWLSCVAMNFLSNVVVKQIDKMLNKSGGDIFLWEDGSL